MDRRCGENEGERRINPFFSIVGISLFTATTLLLTTKPALASASVAGGACLTSALMAIRLRSNLWMTFSACAGSMALNTALTQHRPPDGGWLDHVPALTMATTALAATIGSWLIARPLLADAKTRGRVLIAAPALALCLIGILIQDASYNVAVNPSVKLAGLLLITLAFPVLAIGLALIVAELWRRGRFAEVVLMVGALCHTVAHITGLVVEHSEWIWVAIALSTGGILIASALPSARIVGTPLDRDQHLLSVRIWPAGLAGFAAVGTWAIYRFLGDTNAAIGAAALMVAVAAALFSSRELAGPRKPLVVPFGRADRSLHQLPPQLLRGSVRLIGRPIRRASDGSIVGIEAEASWSKIGNQRMTLVDAAGAAGLEEWLQEVTLASAHAHLPAVLTTLSGDDPFLSVPFDPSVGPALPMSGDELNGLLLRTDAGGDVLVPWQDRGAMIQTAAHQLPARAETIIDVAVIGSGDPMPPTARALLRTSGPTPEAAVSSRLMYVLDEDQKLTDLAVILSPIDVADSELGPVRPL